MGKSKQKKRLSYPHIKKEKKTQQQHQSGKKKSFKEIWMLRVQFEKAPARSVAKKPVNLSVPFSPDGGYPDMFSFSRRGSSTLALFAAWSTPHSATETGTCWSSPVHLYLQNA